MPQILLYHMIFLLHLLLQMYEIQQIAFHLSPTGTTGYGRKRASCILLIFHSAETSFGFFFFSQGKKKKDIWQLPTVRKGEWL